MRNIVVFPDGVYNVSNSRIAQWDRTFGKEKKKRIPTENFPKEITKPDSLSKKRKRKR